LPKPRSGITFKEQWEREVSALKQGEKNEKVSTSSPNVPDRPFRLHAKTKNLSENKKKEEEEKGFVERDMERRRHDGADRGRRVETIIFRMREGKEKSAQGVKLCSAWCREARSSRRKTPDLLMSKGYETRDKPENQLP